MTAAGDARDFARSGPPRPIETSTELFCFWRERFECSVVLKRGVALSGQLVAAGNREYFGRAEPLVINLGTARSLQQRAFLNGTDHDFQPNPGAGF